MFRELKRDGASVLISTHMIDSVEDYWDIAHIMMNGSFAATMRNEPAAQGGENAGRAVFRNHRKAVRRHGKGWVGMKALPLSFFTTLKNRIKELRKHPSQLILVLLFAAMLVLVVVSAGLPSGEPQALRPMAELRAMMLALYAVMFLMLCHNGLSSGASFYPWRMSTCCSPPLSGSSASSFTACSGSWEPPPCWAFPPCFSIPG